MSDNETYTHPLLRSLKEIDFTLTHDYKNQHKHYVSSKDIMKDLSNPAHGVLPTPKELIKINKQLSDLYGTAPTLKNDIQSEKSARESWEMTKSSQNYKEGLTRREFLTLCGMSEVVREPEFLDLLEEWDEKFTNMAIPLLLSSLHQTWGENPYQGNICYFLNRHLSKYNGNRGYLELWSKNKELYLSEEGIKEFAWVLKNEKYSLSQLANQYQLPSSSSLFMDLIRKEALREMIRELKTTSTYAKSSWDYLFEQLIQKHDYPELSELIRIADRYADRDAEEFLKQWFLELDRFGDPRIYNGNWDSKIDSNARDIFIRWLSKEDLTFFFDLILKKGEDEHGRREFWLQYISDVVTSRVILSDEDWNRNRQILSEMKEANKTMPARMHDPTSTFIMQTKKFVIIEFSEKGNACYIYSKDDLHKSLVSTLSSLYDRKKVIAKSDLTRPYLPLLTNNDAQFDALSIRVIHNSGWQRRLKSWLEIKGIRRKGS